MIKPATLLIPEKKDIEFDQVIAAWVERGGIVKRLGKYWTKDESLTNQPIAIYGNQTFALVLAQIYDVQLLSPDDALIARLDAKWTKRCITIKQVSQLSGIDFPVFIKPVIPKLFLADIFYNLIGFRQVTKGLQDNDEILVSNIVDNIQAEARSYIMDGEIKDLALYEGFVDLATGEEFLISFIKNNRNNLPKVVVIDIAYAEQTGWFVLEFNACWGAGLNNCKAEKIIDCIIGATVNN